MTRRLPLPPGMIRMREAAAELGLSRHAARRYFRRKGLARKLGGRWFVLTSPRELPVGVSRGDSRWFAAAFGISVNAARQRLRRSEEVGRKIGGRWFCFYATATGRIISPYDL